MEEVNIKICQNKTKAERIPKKLFQSKNINTKNFFFSLCCIKMKQKALMVGKQYISNMHSIKIVMIMQRLKEQCCLKQIHLNSLLDI